MKAKDQSRVDALRLLKSELKKKEIDKRSPLDEAEAQKVVESLAKRQIFECKRESPLCDLRGSRRCGR